GEIGKTLFARRHPRFGVADTGGGGEKLLRQTRALLRQHLDLFADALGLFLGAAERVAPRIEIVEPGIDRRQRRLLRRRRERREDGNDSESGDGGGAQSHDRSSIIPRGDRDAPTEWSWPGKSVRRAAREPAGAARSGSRTREQAKHASRDRNRDRRRRR